mmetsp:Transcript_55942/g.131739  ORF Transcript_55942/g.131739 Transcript_55942/m.131739 type:complete len:216 (-) Transcript_55942:385-1032(-)
MCIWRTCATTTRRSSTRSSSRRLNTLLPSSTPPPSVSPARSLGTGSSARGGCSSRRWTAGTCTRPSPTGPSLTSTSSSSPTAPASSDSVTSEPTAWGSLSASWRCTWRLAASLPIASCLSVWTWARTTRACWPTPSTAASSRTASEATSTLSLWTSSSTPCGISSRTRLCSSRTSARTWRTTSSSTTATSRTPPASLSASSTTTSRGQARLRSRG